MINKKVTFEEADTWKHAVCDSLQKVCDDGKCLTVVAQVEETYKVLELTEFISFVTFALKMRKVMFWSPCIYLFICMSVTRITQKVLNRIAWNLVGWLVNIRGPFDSILGSIGSKVKVKVMKRSTSSFYHSTANFYPIVMQLMPKCS